MKAETVRFKAIIGIGRFEARQRKAGKKKAWTVKSRLVVAQFRLIAIAFW